MNCAQCPLYYDCCLQMPGAEYLEIQKNSMVMFYICERDK
jgi:hypothetical protein